MNRNVTWLSIVLILIAFGDATVIARSKNGNPLRPNVYSLPTKDDGNFDTSGKSPITPTLSSPAVFVTVGQSRIVNNSSSPASPYTPTHGSQCINLNPYDGFYYQLIDPVLGNSASPGFFYAGWHGRLCDKLITAGKYTQIIFIPIGMAGSSVTDWMSGAANASRIQVASNFLTAKALTPTAWMWQQGTADCIAGMDQTTYTTDLRAVISFQRSQSGRSSDKWVIAQDTIHSGTTCAGIRAAQAAVAGDANNFLGPDADTVPAPDYDGLHYNDTGNDWIAGQWSTNIQSNF